MGPSNPLTHSETHDPPLKIPDLQIHLNSQQFDIFYSVFSKQADERTDFSLSPTPPQSLSRTAGHMIEWDRGSALHCTPKIYDGLHDVHDDMTEFAGACLCQHVSQIAGPQGGTMRTDANGITIPACQGNLPNRGRPHSSCQLHKSRNTGQCCTVLTRVLRLDEST